MSHKNRRFIEAEEDDNLQYEKSNRNSLSFELNPEQQKAIHVIEGNEVTILTGKAGTGKTQLATYYALSKFREGRFDKIVITRPTVSEEKLGYLKGDLKQKMDPWLYPIYHCFYALADKNHIETQVKLGNIEISPIAFMRGRTFVRSIVILDEAQNITHSQMKMILTRLGVGSKIIVCGDKKQSDLNEAKISGLNFVLEKIVGIPGIGHIELETNHRSPLVDKIIDIYESNE